MKLAVCIPCYNESNYITKTLQSLSLQEDNDFKVFVCDNCSTDRTASIAENAGLELGLNLEVVTEKLKGTGAAADTAFREAIAQGYDLLARTDADAIVDVSWTKSIRNHFQEHPNGLAAGVTGPINGEVSYPFSVMLRAATLVGATFGLFRPSNYRKGLRGLYVMTNGNNLAIDSETYLAVGGFRRTRIEELHEDRQLVNDVRAAGGKVFLVRAMKVQVSARRVNAWGLLNSLKWYANHSYKGEQIDIR